MSAKPVKVPDQYRLVMECRSSGLTDYQWCVEKGICPSTFYGWVRRLHLKGYKNIPEPVHGQRGCSKQEVVRIDQDTPALPAVFPAILAPPRRLSENLIFGINLASFFHL